MVCLCFYLLAWSMYLVLDGHILDIWLLDSSPFARYIVTFLTYLTYHQVRTLAYQTANFLSHSLVVLTRRWFNFGSICVTEYFRVFLLIYENEKEIDKHAENSESSLGLRVCNFENRVEITALAWTTDLWTQLGTHLTWMSSFVVYV